MRIRVLAVAVTLAACVATPEILVTQPGKISPAELVSFRFRSSEAVVESGDRGARADAQVRDRVLQAQASGVAASRSELSTGALRATDQMLREFPARKP